MKRFFVFFIFVFLFSFLLVGCVDDGKITGFVVSNKEEKKEVVSVKEEIKEEVVSELPVFENLESVSIGYDFYSSILGDSMNPVLLDGDVVLGKYYGDEDLEEGTIIRFVYKDGSLVVHRVHKVVDGTIITKGDNNEGVDFFTITKHKVMGIIVGIVRERGVVS